MFHRSDHCKMYMVAVAICINTEKRVAKIVSVTTRTAIIAYCCIHRYTSMDVYQSSVSLSPKNAAVEFFVCTTPQVLCEY